MKFNFGTGLVIAMGLFMIFILQYVIRVQFDSRYDNELVTKDYYQQELEIDGKAQRETKALALQHPLVIKQNPQGITLDFPIEFQPEQVKGKIYFYRPSNEKLDFNKDIVVLPDASMHISEKDLLQGRWDLVVEWNYQGNEYRSVEKINWKPF
ncbi:FixH family protein [Myroides sp. LJL115]